MNLTKIEWADYTWNPITGCFHDCPYCYARRIATRFNGTKAWPHGFTPTFHLERLNEVGQKPPGVVFVCSMSDIGGTFILESWRSHIYWAMDRAPYHTYIMLSKKAGGLPSVLARPNWWRGVTAETQDRLEGRVQYLGGPRTIINLEPLHGPIDLAKACGDGRPSWVIVGEETGNRKGKVKVDPDWVRMIKTQCRIWHVPCLVKKPLSDTLPSIGDGPGYRYPPEIAAALRKRIR